MCLDSVTKRMWPKHWARSSVDPNHAEANRAVRSRQLFSKDEIAFPSFHHGWCYSRRRSADSGAITGLHWLQLGRHWPVLWMLLAEHFKLTWKLSWSACRSVREVQGLNCALGNLFRGVHSSGSSFIILRRLLVTANIFSFGKVNGFSVSCRLL